MSAKRSVGLVDSRIGADPIIVGILAFFVGHMAIRLFGTSNFSVDETMTAIHTQRFHLVYLLPNPPLFDWLYFGLSRVLGNSLLTMQILKTALLSGGAVFLYLAVKPCFRHRAALAATMASYGATAFYGWEVLQLYSHTNALIFAMGFTLWAFMRVIRFRNASAYVLLGVGLALGILSKYLFGLFFVALVAAALRSPDHRRRLLSWRALLTLATGAALVSPLLYGLSGAIDRAASAVAARVVAGGGVWASLADLAVQSAQFWLPFAAILWACLARWPGKTEANENGAHAVVDRASFEGGYTLLRDATLLMVAATLAAALFLGTRIRAGHYLVPVLSLLPIVVFAGLDRRQPFPGTAVRKFQQSAVAVIVAVAVVRLLFFLFASPPFCVPRCVLFVDYGPVVAQLDGSDERQTVILSNELHIASNLLRLVPNARVIVPTDAGGLGAGLADPDRRSCYFVWFETYRGSDERALESALRQLLRRAPTDNELAAIGSIAYVKADWQTKLLWDRGADTMIGIATIESDSSLCEGNQMSVRLTAP